MFAVGILNYGYSMRIESFEDTAIFVNSVLSEEIDVSKKKESIREAVKHLQNSDLDLNFRIAALDEIKCQLSDVFPFVSDLIKEAIQQIAQKNLYGEGEEADLGKRLFNTQTNKITLDILLRSARLLNIYDQPFFTDNVKPFMEKKRLLSYF